MDLLNFPRSAYIVEHSIKELYDGVPTASPISSSAIGTPPTVAYRCRVTVTSVTGHANCTGSVTIAGEAMDFATSGQKKTYTTTITASNKPVISYSGLNCSILIECLDVAGQEILTETTTAIAVKYEPELVTLREPTGAFTTYNGYFMMVNSTVDLGSVIRFNSIDYNPKRIEPLCWIDGTEVYRIVYF